MSANRLQVSYENRSAPFYRKNQEFKKQFCHIYATRLQKLGNELLKNKAIEKFSDKYPLKKISELNEDHPETCIIIGTFYKDQVLKPSILKEISNDHKHNEAAGETLNANYHHESDKLILEDDLQRIRLEGKVNVPEMITGVVGAVLGYIGGAGMFEVKECLFYECGPEVPLKSINNSPLVVFMSGIDLANPENAASSLDLFQQWIYGNIDMPDEFDPTNVVRVVIAGNSVRACAAKAQKNMSSLTLRTIDTKDMLTSLKLLDGIVSEMSQSIEVDLMPGEFDPSNHMLPQQPFHHCMFPKSAVNRTFNGVPNPYQFEVEGRLILGTSGQNVDDMRKYSTVEDPIECLKNSLKWSHIAPTCPDTLPCYPYFEEDPFIINQCPHVYFCAQNDANFKTEVFKNSNGQDTRLFTIPSFQKSRTVVILNLKTLDCRPMCFGTNNEEVEE